MVYGAKVASSWFWMSKYITTRKCNKTLYIPNCEVHLNVVIWQPNYYRNRWKSGFNRVSVSLWLPACVSNQSDFKSLDISVDSYHFCHLQPTAAGGGPQWGASSLAPWSALADSVLGEHTDIAIKSKRLNTRSIGPRKTWGWKGWLHVA